MVFSVVMWSFFLNRDRPSVLFPVEHPGNEKRDFLSPLRVDHCETTPQTLAKVPKRFLTGFLAILPPEEKGGEGGEGPSHKMPGSSRIKEADWIDGPERLVPLAELETPPGLIGKHPAPESLHPVANRLSRVFRVACDCFQEVQLFGLVDQIGGGELLTGSWEVGRQSANESFEGGPGLVTPKAEGSLCKGAELRIEVVNDGTNHACPL